MNPTPERSYWCAGLYLNFLAESQDTGGGFTLIESVVRQGTEPPPHLHTYEDEQLLVLEGELEYRFGGQCGRLGPGEHVVMPRRLEHYFRALTPEVRLLVRLSPGGLEEGFKAFGVSTVDYPLPPPREEVPPFPEIARIFAGLGVHFTPPERSKLADS